MRAFGLDIGARRIGVAVSDATGTLASPLTVLDAERVLRDPRPFLDLVEEYEPTCLVVGVPVTLAGERGAQAQQVAQTAEALAAAAGLPLEYWDERLSSVEARRAMRAAGLSDRKQRGARDKVAAALVLQGWLDARRSEGGRER